MKVVEAGSLSRAATYLDLANASVTTCLRNLETHLGLTLLQRSTRHVTLTEEGAKYYDQCRDILLMVETAEAAAAPSGTHLQGMLRVELPTSLGHLIIGPALSGFAQQQPDLRITVNLTNGVDSLIRRGIDVAIRMDEIDDADLVAKQIYETRHVLCASPAFLRDRGTPTNPSGIDPASCIGFTKTVNSQPRSWLFERDGRQVPVRDFVAWIAAAATGVG